MIVSPSAYRGYGLCGGVAFCLCTPYNHVYHSGAGNYRDGMGGVFRVMAGNRFEK